MSLRPSPRSSPPQGGAAAALMADLGLRPFMAYRLWDGSSTTLRAHVAPRVGRLVVRECFVDARTGTLVRSLVAITPPSSPAPAVVPTAAMAHRGAYGASAAYGSGGAWRVMWLLRAGFTRTVFWRTCATLPELGAFLARRALFLEQHWDVPPTLLRPAAPGGAAAALLPAPGEPRPPWTQLRSRCWPPPPQAPPAALPQAPPQAAAARRLFFGLGALLG